MNPAPWLSFAAPQWLAGLLAVLGPVAAHLWSRRLGPPRRFPAVRLMVEAQRDTRRATRLNDVALLLLRCLAIALIALAFAQPVTRSWEARAALAPAVGERSGESAQRAVLIVDASASMSRVVGGRTLFERASDEAAAMIERGGSATEWAVVIAADPPRALLPEPTRSTEALLRRLRAAEVSGRHAALADAYRLAGRWMIADEGRPTVLHVWSDGQSTATAGAGDVAALPDGTTFVPHVMMTNEAPSNLGVSAARLDPDRPMVGRRAAIVAEVRNFGDRPRRATVRFSGVAGGGEKALDLAGNGRATVRFDVRATRTAATVATIAIDDREGWSIDDRQSVPLLNRGPVDVALLSRGAVDDPAGPAFYVARAISPASGGRLRARVLDLEAIESAARPEVVVSVAPPGLSDRQRETLAEWAQAGTGFVEVGASVLPASLSPLVRAHDASVDAPAKLSPIDAGEPPWSVFEGEALATLLSVGFEHPIAVTRQPGRRVLARWVDDGPAMASGSAGRGRVIQWAVEMKGARPALFRSPAFVPLMQELVEAVRATTSPLAEAQPGQRVRQVLEAPAPAEGLKLVDPNGNAVEATLYRDEHGTVIGEATLPTGPSAIGFYRWLDAGGRLVGAISVALDERESDLRHGPIPAPGAGEPATPDAGDKEASAATSRSGRWVERPLWPWFVAAAALALCGELALGRWIGLAGGESAMHGDRLGGRLPAGRQANERRPAA